MNTKLNTAQVLIISAAVILLSTGCASTGRTIQKQSPTGQLDHYQRLLFEVTSQVPDSAMDAQQLESLTVVKLREKNLFEKVFAASSSSDAPADVKLKASITALNKVSPGSRVMFGAMAGQGKMVVKLELIETSSARVLSTFTAEGKTSGGSAFAGTTEQAVNRVVEQIVQYMQQLKAPSRETVNSEKNGKQAIPHSDIPAARKSSTVTPFARSGEIVDASVDEKTVWANVFINVDQCSYGNVDLLVKKQIGLDSRDKWITETKPLWSVPITISNSASSDVTIDFSTIQLLDGNVNSHKPAYALVLAGIKQEHKENCKYTETSFDEGSDNSLKAIVLTFSDSAKKPLIKEYTHTDGYDLEHFNSVSQILEYRLSQTATNEVLVTKSGQSARLSLLFDASSIVGPSRLVFKGRVSNNESGSDRSFTLIISKTKAPLE